MYSSVQLEVKEADYCISTNDQKSIYCVSAWQRNNITTNCWGLSRYSADAGHLGFGIIVGIIDKVNHMNKHTEILLLLQDLYFTAITFAEYIIIDVNTCSPTKTTQFWHENIPQIGGNYNQLS